ncbi:hypothetical protein BSKO_12221 [Bryopsis sp. KO-2023]|nr:hypothetical protein BSKO_12221 [Bryopsis sp. KO-2023]
MQAGCSYGCSTATGRCGAPGALTRKTRCRGDVGGRKAPFNPLHKRLHVPIASRTNATSSFGEPSPEQEGTKMSPQEEGFCIIEGRDMVKDFAEMQSSELEAQIESRRSKIFLLMEEVRRMKILMRVKGGDKGSEEEINDLSYSSAIPILQEVPFLKEKNVRKYYTVYFGIALGVILFGGFIAPVLEVRMGMGGQSYVEFIRMMHLPEQLAYVDPIVASFCGGAIGVLSAFLIVDANYIKNQQRNRCYYCQGTGYLTCASCVGTGSVEEEGGCRCALCSGSGKVMCTNCFCTGKHLVTEHDPRIDPFD